MSTSTAPHGDLGARSREPGRPTASPADGAGPGSPPEPHGTRRGPLRLWLRGWTSVVHLVLDAVLAGFFLAIVVAVISFGLLSSTLVGLPLLALTLVVAFAAIGAERWRIALLLGTWVPPMEPRPPHLPTWRRYLLDPRPWRSLLYLTLISLWGLTGGVVVLALLLAAVTATLAPLLPPGSVSLGADPLPQGLVWAAGAVGLLTLLVLPFLAWGFGRVDVAVARLSISSDPAARVAELSARVDTLTETRERAVDSVEAERRRIERDLHDGPQQRLVALAMDLGLARQRLATDPAGTAELLDRAHASAKEAVADLRRVARGIHPPVLTDRGLDAALSALAARSPVPVSVHVAPGPRPPARLEAIAYFSVSEALTNVAKHASAASARVDVDVQPVGGRPHLVATVTDDGRGGADPTRGTGLRGLRDRVAAVDGDVLVSSPPGGPTVLSVRLPLPEQPTTTPTTDDRSAPTTGGPQ
ncbi:sensor histidine kinase [Aquipuribacter nitratireducens]|uniref:histidine kinase n=1 Tax=Aquipuribacter nitratireducens TaxID=650104 RepID=A0ABW0GPA4_9MICO